MTWNIRLDNLRQVHVLCYIFLHLNCRLLGWFWRSYTHWGNKGILWSLFPRILYVQLMGLLIILNYFDFFHSCLCSRHSSIFFSFSHTFAQWGWCLIFFVIDADHSVLYRMFFLNMTFDDTLSSSLGSKTTSLVIGIRWPLRTWTRNKILGDTLN